METKYTPGPWRPVTDGISYWVEIDGIIAMVMNCRHKQAQSKAALIAAAPELADALAWALEQIEDDLSPDHQEALAHARAVLARAQGVDP
jgi:hypothetical protein